MTLQTITLHLDGITAADYLAWVRDAEPPARALGLRAISIDADPLGSTISATLEWDRPAPPVQVAAAAAGLPITADVQRVTGGALRRPKPARVHAPRPERLAA
jgi:hypothetical protein